MNLKPSVEGIIYKEFEEDRHVKTWNEMWKILTGVDFPGECTHDIFVTKCQQMKLPCYAGIDWGWSNPSTLTVVYIDKRDNIYIVGAYGMTLISNPMWAQIIKAKYHRMYNVDMYYIDTANPGDILTMKQEGLPVNTDIAKSNINDGIQIIKKKLYSLDSPEPKLFIAKDSCNNIIIEFGKYHYKLDSAGIPTDIPASEDDHWLDGLRYILYKIFGKNEVLLDCNGENNGYNLLNNDGTYNRVPTAEEYADLHGIQYDPNIDMSKIGKIGTESELNHDDDDSDDICGSGGFFWSF
jgi:hypothetical protein